MITGITRDKKQIRLVALSGFKFELFKDLKFEKNDIFDQIDLSFQTPGMGRKKRLDPIIRTALENLRGKGTISSITVLINVKKGS